MLTFFWHLELAVAFFETYFPIRDLGVGLKDENMMMKKKMRQNLLMRGGLPYPWYHLYFRNSSSIYIKDMDDEIADAKCKEIYCEACRHNIKKFGRAIHLKTKKHIENEKGVEEVEKKQCRKCGCWRVREL